VTATVRRGRPSDWRVAVPSYRRARVLAAKTLPWLLDGGVPADRVTVFLHDHDPQLSDYADVLDGAGVRHVTTTARGIRGQRAAILDHYPPGTPLLQADDDVTGLAETRRGKLEALPGLPSWILGMFTETASRDLWLWGVAPVPNAFFLKEGQVSEGLKFCIGTVWGCYTRPGHPVHSGTAETKEDYEACLRAWWYDGAVVRADGVAPKADHYSPGGCEQLRSPAVEEASVQVLERGFPGLVRRNTKRQGPYPEVLLARRGRGPRRPAHTPLPGAAR
jgi:hypothetical protein